MARNRKRKSEPEATDPGNAAGGLMVRRVVVGTAIIVAVFHGWAVVFPSALTWGAHHVAFLSPSWVASTLAMALMLIPGVQSRVLDVLTRIELWWTKKGKVQQYVIMAVGVMAMGLLFWRARQVTFFLGDGIFAQRSLTNIQAAENIPVALQNAPLPGFITWKIYQHLLERKVDQAATTAFQLVSVVSGVLALFVLSRIARSLSGSRLQRWLVFAVLLGGGTVQMFFGYVENYTVTLLMALVFFWLGLEYLGGKVHLALPSLAFGGMFASHFGMFYLLPAILVLYVVAIRKRRWNEMVLSIVVTLAGTYAILSMCGYSPATVKSIFLKEGGAHLVPILQKSTGWHAYTLVSGWHAIDLANLYVLLSPFVVPLFVVIGTAYTRRVRLNDVRWIFLAVAGVLSVAFTVGFNFDIGMSRDWDLLGAYNAGLIAAGLFLLVAVPGGEKDRLRLMVVVAGMTILHTLPWVALNADRESSIERFKSLRDDRLWGAAAIIYANEDLGGYYRDSKEYDKALEFYREGLAIDSTNSRRWLVLAHVYQTVGREEEMVYALEKAVRLGTRLLQTHLQLGEMYVKRNDFDRALEVWKKGLELDPSSGAFAYFIGNTLVERYGRYEEGLPYLERASLQYPDAIEILYPLGLSYRQTGNHERAHDVWGRLIKVAPQHPHAPAIRKYLGG